MLPQFLHFHMVFKDCIAIEKYWEVSVKQQAEEKAPEITLK